MTAIIQPLIGRTISNLIAVTYGPVLAVRDADILDYCQKMGEVYAGFVDGDLVCCWGLIPPSFLSMEAYLWMWCCKETVPHQFIFIRQSQIQVRKMLERYESIVGVTMLGNRKAMRWLKWLGAEFSDYPEDGKLPFTIRRKANG